MSKPFLSLAYFVNRSQVLKQYRTYLREIRMLEKDARKDMRLSIRAKFEEAKYLQDPHLVKQAIAYGNAQLQHVRELVNSVGTRPQKNVSNSTWIEQVNEESEDNGAMDDVRGRIGAGWPWQKK
ncbi:hypothetical protein THRCLA_22275 [Thraustotheca clavata]|uniref:Complex 1 LYR protein domain-containing protein n=1 Tax=Thraustotheca clavata TaxID=74557 RepID=A0A1V9Z7N6_9STRA|nr:hypothetical protein THRCLA_22275 [Thraustotheca clavata]